MTTITNRTNLTNEQITELVKAHNEFFADFALPETQGFDLVDGKLIQTSGVDPQIVVSHI